MMINQEFKTQTLRTSEQWKSGLAYCLEPAEGGGITLYPLPAFAGWIKKPDGIKKTLCLAVDGCGQIYFIDSETCRLYRYNPVTEISELLPCISGCGSEPGKVKGPARILLDKFTIWVLDAGNKRVLAYSRDNCQIKYVIDKYSENDEDRFLEHPVDIALDRNGNIYVLDRKIKRIFKYDHHAGFAQGFGDEALLGPIGIASGKDNKLYVIDGEQEGFLIFSEEGEYSGLTGHYPEAFRPSVIAIDPKGDIFVADKQTGQIRQFDPNGDFVGIIPVPDFKGKVFCLAVDSKGSLYATTSDGIALFSAEQNYTREPGAYYSKTLDSGIEDCPWHRLALEADIPDKTVLEIYYASGDETLKKTIDEVLSSNTSAREKAKLMDDKIPWIGPETDPRDMLFRGKTGRYLWLKLVLSTFDDMARPTVKNMKVFYPRVSYLRYLPAIYQEDPVSKDFLERFLSIFETVFYDLETEISHIFKYLGADTAPRKFLAWLASWLNLAMEEDWPEEKKRKLINEAYSLYKQKGTLSGISGLIEIYTGKPAILMEHSRIGKPMVLGKEFRIGIGSVLVRTPIRGFRLGDDSILGRVSLRDTVQSPEDPFLPLAHRFTVILDLTPEEFSVFEKGVRKILDEWKPSHTVYALRALKQMRLGVDTYVGINRLDDYSQLILGVNYSLGSAILLMGEEQSGRVGRHSRIEKDTELS